MTLPSSLARAGLLVLLLAGCAQLKGASYAIPPNILLAAPLEAAASERGRYQRLILDLAGAWANCDAALMRRTLAADVDFSYPTTRLIGLDKALADLAAFCARSSARSFYFPADAFYIDTQAGRIAAELQFRACVDGHRQVVNDVWIATIRGGRIAILKEYLDGRVKTLQREGVLSYGEGAEFLTPWPPRVAAPQAE